jgi:hypothetical protein
MRLSSFPQPLPDKSLEGTANSVAFIRETCMVIALSAPPLSSSVIFLWHQMWQQLEETDVG